MNERSDYILTTTPSLSRNDWTLILSLALLTFVLGTSEFVIVGILPDIADGLTISIATAGTLVSAFAISFAIGTPLMMSFTSHMPKRRLMLGLTLGFIVLNFLSSQAPNYGLLLSTRMVTAVVTGVLISLAMLVASESVPPTKRGIAVSFIFGGFTMANVFGVPLGTFIGQRAGWEATFFMTTALGVVALFAVYRVVPNQLSSAKTSISDQLRLLTNPRILIAFFIPALGFGATYVVYTYLVPILKGVLGVPVAWISPILLAYGFISIFSNMAAGKIASHNPIGRLRFVFLIQAVVLAALYVTTSNVTLGLINIALMSFMAILLTTSTQIYLIDLAEKFNPDAKGLASSLMPVASNVGIGMGSALGGLVYANAPVMMLALVGGAVALLTAALTSLSHRLDQR
ncbi:MULTISPECIES: MFS transporter [unclassified Exiguobacterium]|uniref:MFS transporter n=1 Tax=unclassified Exiguobacterium TaxID=2644629 RepID=UPI00104005F7|nr:MULTISPECIES: MFS transporter [unclassified Exiguobacterium]TCI44311.1 MFS transporter [Exiguobacterium sp. SH5S32]TCI50575.1 MFS transporter [Exiguobacterium sp. SH1S4]TCI77092.1 MFS transporter [Exiguobacterium sp. SH0S1]TCI34558.1 MFS transporter [Exiguobacterium sp. SH4S7]TCI69535.1 MFS transporter [Exiguobacterium sp. SH1S1]